MSFVWGGRPLPAGSDVMNEDCAGIYIDKIWTTWVLTRLPCIVGSHNIFTLRPSEFRAVPIYTKSLTLEAGPSVNFSPMSPKLVRTEPHTVENRGITMTPLFLRLMSWKSLTQSIKIFVKLDFFTNVLVVCFVFVYTATLLRASADCTRKELPFWFWQWQRCEF